MIINRLSIAICCNKPCNKLESCNNFVTNLDPVVTNLLHNFAPCNKVCYTPNLFGGGRSERFRPCCNKCNKFFAPLAKKIFWLNVIFAIKHIKIFNKLR